MYSITTKEAKEKICPFMSLFGMYGSLNKCITNNCISWEYTKLKDIQFTETKDYQKVEVIYDIHQTEPFIQYEKELSEDDKMGICIRLNGRDDFKV